MWRDFLNIWKADNLLKQAWQQSFEMLQITEEMFIEAVRSLRESDNEKMDEKIREKDKIVNEYEREVRKKVLTHLSVQAPRGLPAGLVLVSIVIDIERIGDFTKNIIELAVNHPSKLSGGKFENDLQRVEAAVKENFTCTRGCFESSDEASARTLIEEYRWVNQVCDKSLMGLVREEDKSIKPGDAVSLALYFRWLKRIYSHLRNITTSVVNPFDRISFKPAKK